MIVTDKSIDKYYNSEFDLLTEKVFGFSYVRSTDYDNNTAEKCYLSSNEYLMEYMNQFNLKNKRVATVGSSGDQVLNALFYGSRDVTLIDANAYAMAYTEYKIALIKEFDFITFRKKLGTRSIFEWQTYQKISHHLPKNVQQFWDRLMLEQDNEDLSPFYYDNFTAIDIYRNLTHGYTKLEGVSEFYINENAYNMLKNILLENNFKLEYKIADLFNFPNELKGQYYLILLSNINNYMTSESNTLKFRETIKKLYENNLTQDGTIQVDYEFFMAPEWTKDQEFGFKTRIQELTQNNHSDTVFFIDKKYNESNNTAEYSFGR